MSQDPTTRSQRLAVLYLQLAAHLASNVPRDTRHRLLLLAGRHASDSGWQNEADACHQYVLRNNPRHLVRRFSSMAAALLSADYLALERQFKRQCPQERAEHLADIQNLDDPAVAFDSLLQAARDLLDQLDRNTTDSRD